MEEALENTASGLLLQRATDLDFMLQAGMRVTPDDITLEEFRALRTLRDERKRWEQEKLKQP